MGMPLVQEGPVLLDPSKMPMTPPKLTAAPKLTTAQIAKAKTARLAAQKSKQKPSQFSFRNAGMITGPGGKQVDRLYNTY